MAANAKEIERLIVRLVGDPKHLQAMLQQASKATQTWAARTRATVNTIGRQLFIPAAAGVALVTKSIKEAADAAETMSKFRTVFKEQSAAVKQWAAEVAKATNRSKHELIGFLAEVQDLFQPLGFAANEARKMSQQVTQLAIDLGSFNNLNTADVVRDLQAALTGSGEVMKKYGVIVSEAAVKQELFNMGLDPKKVTEQQKVLARLNIIMAGTTAAQGDATRTAGDFSNQVRGLLADFKDLRIELGTQLLPALMPFVEAMREALTVTDGVAGGVSSLAEKLGTVADVLHTLPILWKGLHIFALKALGPIGEKVHELRVALTKLADAMPGVDLTETVKARELEAAKSKGEVQNEIARLQTELDAMLMKKTPSELMEQAATKRAQEEAAAAAKQVGKELDGLGAATKRTADGFSTLLPTIAGALRGALQGLQPKLNKSFQGLMGEVQTQWTAMMEALAEVNNHVNPFRGAGPALEAGTREAHEWMSMNYQDHPANQEILQKQRRLTEEGDKFGNLLDRAKANKGMENLLDKILTVLKSIEKKPPGKAGGVRLPVVSLP